MKVVPGIRFRPSGPDLGLIAPTHVGSGLQPVKPPVICLRKVLVLMSITSTDLLFRSVKYIRPLALSTSLMSKEKLVPETTLGTLINASGPVFKLLPPPPPPPQPPSIRVAAIAAPTIERLFMLVLLVSIYGCIQSRVDYARTKRESVAYKSDPCRSSTCWRFAGALLSAFAAMKSLVVSSTPINAARSCLASQPFPFR